MQALLRILSDAVQFFEKQLPSFSARKSSSDVIVGTIKPFLDSIVKFYRGMSGELRTELKTQYGGNGPTQHWRYLQKAIHDEYKEFLPEGLEAWWADNSKQYNIVSQSMLESISAEIIHRVKKMLDETDNDIPIVLRSELNSRRFAINEERKSQGLPVLNDWDVFTLDDCLDLANQGSLWSEGLKTVLTRPEQEGRQGGNKAAKTKWLSDMSKIQNALKRSSYSVKQADYEYITSIYRWLFGEDSTAAESEQKVIESDAV